MGKTHPPTTMITSITGARRNVGDHLIVERGQKLIPDVVVNMSRFHRFDYNTINDSKCVVLLGGPAIARSIYPHVYPLDLNKIKVPIVALGLGLFRDDDLFTSQSITFLKMLKAISVRDNLTHDVLKKNGIDSVVTGCPAWFNPDGIKPIVKKEINTVAVSPSQFHDVNHVEKLHGIVDYIRKTYPDKEKLMIFNDAESGFDSDGFERVDCSTLQEFKDAYSLVDYHYGMRVHSHIYMISMGKPSDLVTFDIRGEGATDLIKDENDIAYYYEVMKGFISENVCGNDTR